MVPSDDLFLRLYINEVANWLSLLIKCQKVKSIPRNDTVAATDLSPSKYLNDNIYLKLSTNLLSVIYLPPRAGTTLYIVLSLHSVSISNPNAK